MQELKSYQSVEEYLHDQLSDTRKLLVELIAIIKSTLPNSYELINYNMPAYSITKDGNRKQQIMIAGYKKFVGFYVGNNILANFETELRNYKTGKASIQFPLNKPLPVELIQAKILFKLKKIEATLETFIKN